MNASASLLIIEPDVHQQRILAAPFRVDNLFGVRVAASLADGLHAHAQHPADFIVLNACLFVADTADWLRQFHAVARAFTLALAPPDEIDVLLAAGVDDCLLPPYPAALVHHRIAHHWQLHARNHELSLQIVERQQAQTFLDDERTLLRALLDNMPDEVFVKDTEGFLLTANRTMLNRFGLNIVTNVVEQSIRELDLYPPPTAHIIQDLDRRVFEQGETINNHEMVVRRENSTDQRWILITRIPMKNKDGRVIGIVGINRDITALRLADETLNRERNLLRALMDNIPDEIFAKDTEGRIVLSNSAHMARVGSFAPSGGVIGSTNYDYMSREIADERREWEHKLLHEVRKPVTREMRTKVGSANNQVEWVLATQVPLYDEHGNPSGIVGINRDITQVKRAEQRLNDVIQAAQCLLWQAVAREAHVDGRLTTRWDFEIVDNEAAMRFLPMNIQPGQTYADAWRDSIIDYEQLKRESDEAIFSGREHYVLEFQSRQADGIPRWMREEIRVTRLTPVTYHLVGVVMDITERKQAEFTLQRANELLEQRVRERTLELSHSNEILREQRKLAEALRDSALALGETLKLNDVLDRLLIYASRILPSYESASISLIEEAIYVRVIRHHRRQDNQSVQIRSYEDRYLLDSYPIYTEARQTGQPIVVEDVNTDARWIFQEITSWIQSYMCLPITLEGRVIGFINMSSKQIGLFQQEYAERMTAFSSQADVAIQNARLFEATQRHAQELQERVAERTRELESERAQLRAILDSMNEGVIYHTLDGQNLYVNPSLIQMTGYDEADWLGGENMWEQMHAQEGDETVEEFLNTYQTKLMRQGYWKGEIRLKQRGGEVFDAALSCTLVHSRGQSSPGIVSVLRDISAEKQLEAQKARFIATASHELRTPIANIKTRLYLLQKTPDTLPRHMPVLVNVTERMRRLVDDLLDVSRFEHGIIKLNRVPLRVDEVVQQAVEVQEPDAEQRGLTLTWEAADVPHWVSADSQRLQQVITNLVSNAMNYTPEGGSITVNMTHERRDGNIYCVIHVHDTGIGIPDHLQPDIFKPFFRVNDFNAGVGLGLSITKEIVEMHEGEITLHSKIGEGTRFDVWLPALPPEEVPA